MVDSSWLGSRSRASSSQSANFQQYRDISVKPLNFQPETPHKYTSAGKRIHLPLQNSSMESKRRTAENSDNMPRNYLNNRVLLSSQGQRLVKGIKKQDLYIPTFVISNFDRKKSKFQHEYDQLVKHFQNANTKVQELPFSINLYQKHSIIRDHIMKYLESRIDINHLRRQIPQQTWTEQQIKRYFVNYQPSSADLSHKMITQQASVTVKKHKNCLYFGCIKNNLKDGYGVLIHYTGHIFQGQFKEDHKVQGVEYGLGSIYIGKFSNNSYHGDGFLKNQDIKCGKFHKGIFSQGIVFTEESVIFQYGQPIVYRNIAGDIYVGSYDSGKNGIGLQKFTNDDMYIGNYENNLPEGYGQYYWQNGCIFTGDFVGGLRHGNGQWSNRDGDSYSGHYENDKKSGDGIFIWRNGTKYCGQFANDYRHGYGEMTWADGRKYQGRWTNGIENDKKIPKKRLRGFSQTLKGQRKLPKLEKQGGNLKWKKSDKYLPKGGIKALFNPNYNFDY